MKFKKELRCAIDAVRQASRLCQYVQSRLVQKDTYEKKIARLSRLPISAVRPLSAICWNKSFPIFR
ncbi:MAG: hypothetical protein U5R06_00590 [candidate division KSB1 bacterium]|nr:hypothetical protein [candidate division KSB1 bacterium]